MDIFDTKSIKPMLIGAEGEPFDSPDYIYELKLDGERCLAYLDETGTDLRNKRNMLMLPKVPELSEIHKQAKKRCIIDGELFVLKEGKPDFSEIQRRSLMTNKIKIDIASKKYPASFAAFDILYYDGKQVNDLPLMERKSILAEAINENEKLAISRYIEQQGIAFYNLTEQQELEGIVAKLKSSRYYFDKRTKDWIKIKYLQDDDFVVCGYIIKEHGVVSVVLGQYMESHMVYKGHVTLGVSGRDFDIIKSAPTSAAPPFEVPDGNESAVWVEPRLVCTVKYMMLNKNGSMRQPVFKGLRDDKPPSECVVKSK